MSEPSNDIALANDVSANAMILDKESWDQINRVATMMASGKVTVPKHFQNSPGDCAAVIMQAMQWRMNPWAVAQKTFMDPSGKIAYEAQLVAAAINSSGLIASRFRFDFFGPWEKVIGKFNILKGEKGEYRVPGWTMQDEEGCGVTVTATLKGESEPRSLDLLLSQAGTRFSTQWAIDPKQQLAYLSEKKWARLYAPDIILGVYTVDEMEDAYAERVINPTPTEEKKAEENKRTDTTNRPMRPLDNAALEKWLKQIEKGEKTTERVLQYVEATYSATLEQIERIKAAKPAIEGEATPEQEAH